VPKYLFDASTCELALMLIENPMLKIERDENVPFPLRDRTKRVMNLTGLALVALVLSTLGACASLPSSGPDIDQVMRGSRGPRPEFSVVDLNTAAKSDTMAPVVDSDGSLTALIGAAPPPVDHIGVGDTLQVTIFEVGEALFGNSSGAGASASGSIAALAPTTNAESLPATPVGPDGYIKVPYVGQVLAAGRSPNEVAAAIEAGLKGKSQSPQVVVTVREDQGNAVFLIGDVKTPGRKPLSYRRERLLDMIAIAGGPTNARSDVLVRVVRDGRSVEMRLGDIRSGSPDDIALQPQDRLELAYRPRTFTAFGATGKVSEIPIQLTRLSLAQALARMGGPTDQQADPTGVFIFRTRQPQGALPVVYRLNLRDPKGFFVAQQFEIQDGDLVYVANARSNAWYKFLSIVNTIVSPVVTAKYLGSAP